MSEQEGVDVTVRGSSYTVFGTASDRAHAEELKLSLGEDPQLDLNLRVLAKNSENLMAHMVDGLEPCDHPSIVIMAIAGHLAQHLVRVCIVNLTEVMDLPEELEKSVTAAMREEMERDVMMYCSDKMQEYYGRYRTFQRQRPAGHKRGCDCDVCNDPQGQKTNRKESR